MAAKLIVVQNELKDGRGHYLETAVAVAEAAARLGLTPYILGHATCPPSLVPPALAFLPVCRLDHQMHDPVVPALNLGPFQLSPSCDPAPSPSPLPPIVRLAKAFTPPVVVSAARRLLRKPAPAPPDPLAAAGFGYERHFIEEWRKDIAFALTLLQADAADHVVFLTAHARELHAVRQIVNALPTDRCPTFHLEFRHALDLGEPDGRPLTPFTAAHLALYVAYRPLGPHPRIRLWTDTAELSEVYARASQLAHFTLPIPFRVGKLNGRSANPAGPRTVAVVGDPRDEKGFHRLPGLIQALEAERNAGALRFTIQANLRDAANNPRSVAALQELRALAGPGVELYGTPGADLPADDYFARVSAADVLAFPFDAAAYARRSSGTLTEAIAAGVPTVVPAGTWLARQQPPGTGETFADDATLAEAVRRVVRGYDGYEPRARASRADWLRTHTPENLVRALLAERPEE